MNQQQQEPITQSVYLPQNGRFQEFTLTTLKNATFQFSHTDLTKKER